MRLIFKRIEDFEEEDGWKIVIWFDQLDDDGQKFSEYRYSMPPDIFEHRIAEYGDVLTEPQLVEIVVAEAAMVLSVGETKDGLSNLFTAPTQKIAREDHLARCARVKLKYRISTKSGALKLQDVLTEKMKVTDQGVESKRLRLREFFARDEDWENM